MEQKNQQQPQTQKPKGKKWKKILIIFLIVLIGIGIAYSIYYLYQPSKAQKPSSNPENDIVNLTVVNNIKNQYTSIVGTWNSWEEQHYEIVSWNTKKYGRIYRVSAWVTDMGEFYYDRKGKKIGNCNAMGGSYTEPGYSCSYFNDLEYKNNDFIQS